MEWRVVFPGNGSAWRPARQSDCTRAAARTRAAPGGRPAGAQRRAFLRPVGAQAADRRSADAMTLRVVDTGMNSAQWNIAVTTAMVEAHGAGGVPDTLRFHGYWPAFLLGCNQKPEHELDVAQCVTRGVEIA